MHKRHREDLSPFLTGEAICMKLSVSMSVSVSVCVTLSSFVVNSVGFVIAAALKSRLPLHAYRQRRLPPDNEYDDRHPAVPDTANIS